MGQGHNYEIQVEGVTMKYKLRVENGNAELEDMLKANLMTSLMVADATVWTKFCSHEFSFNCPVNSFFLNMLSCLPDRGTENRRM